MSALPRSRESPPRSRGAGEQGIRVAATDERGAVDGAACRERAPPLCLCCVVESGVTGVRDQTLCQSPSDQTVRVVP